MRFSKFRPTAKLFAKISLRGLPETISQLAIPVATLCMNHVLLSQMGEIAVNSFSVISYVASFSMAIFLGVAEGSQPLFGTCYGEKNDSDLKYYFRAGTVINLVGGVLVYVLLLFIGGAVSRLFGADEATAAYIVKALPRYGWGFILMSLNMIISAYLYSTKRTKQAVVQNVLRSFVFTIAVIMALPALFGSAVVWYTFGVYEALSLVVALILLKTSEKNGIVYR